MDEQFDYHLPPSFSPHRPAVQRVLAHLCEGECQSFGDILEWCETRGDCSQAVVCPTCGNQFLIDEEDFAELQRWTIANGGVYACGVRWMD